MKQALLFYEKKLEIFKFMKKYVKINYNTYKEVFQLPYTYHNLNKKDFESVRHLVGKAWYEEYEDNPKIYRLYTGYYLYHYVAESSYRIVVKDNDKVIGFLFGNTSKVNVFHYLKYELRVFLLGLKACFSKLGRRGIKITLKTNRVNKRLRKICKGRGAELSLFIVDEAYRGQGIGSQLEKSYLQYLREEHFDFIYLYTDTYSDYQFYDQKGFDQVAGIKVDFKIKGEETDPLPIYFIYKKDI